MAFITVRQAAPYASNSCRVRLAAPDFRFKVTMSKDPHKI